jgi:hypothetical protein
MGARRSPPASATAPRTDRGTSLASRELNLKMPEKQGDQNDPGTLNEIQFPVKKK